MTHGMNIDCAVNLIRALGGGRAVAQRLGVSRSAVSNAAMRGLLPADYFDVLDRMGQDANVPVPRELFNFKRVKAAE